MNEKIEICIKKCEDMHKFADIIDNASFYMLRKFKDGRPSVKMQFMDNCGDNVVDKEAVYFFKFYGKNELCFNKIGTSTRNVISRLRDEIGEYSKKFEIDRVEICRIRACGGMPPEGIESLLRAEFIKQYPTAFRRNDRFFGVEIETAVFDEICNQYFG